MIKEFKEFAMKGNVMDMAVGVIIGAAFGKIVTSLVDNLIMPVVGLFTGGKDFSDQAIQIGEQTVKKEVDGKEVEVIEPLMLNHGAFFQSVLDFLIIAFCIFMMVKAINKANAAMDAARGIEKEEEEDKPAEDIELLKEIRDALKK